MKNLYLGQLIEILERHPREQRVVMGFGSAHSYRGIYEDLAFEPTADTTVGEMLDHAKSALGCTFQGYKGGEYLMTEYTECWIANHGESGGQMIGYILLNYMLGEYDE